MLFMHGGPSQVDTFDYKPRLQRDDGKQLPFEKAKNIDAIPKLLGHPVHHPGDVAQLVPGTPGEPTAQVADGVSASSSGTNSATSASVVASPSSASAMRRWCAVR